MISGKEILFDKGEEKTEMVKRIFLIGSVLLGFYAIPVQGYPQGDSDILYIAQMTRMPKVFTITIHGGFDGNNAVTWLDPIDNGSYISIPFRAATPS